jgi:hypothetical protein
MKLKNNSARPHWIGNILIAPGTVAEVDDEYRGAYNAAELQEVADEAEQPKRGRASKVTAENDPA